MSQIEALVAKQQQSVSLADARVNVWEGSVRSSKTICSLLRWLQFVRTGPAANLVMIGRSERTLKRNIVDVLVEMLGPKRCRARWGDGELMLLGRRVYLAGASNEAAVGKIQGITLAGAYVDEVSLMPESMWSMLLSRLSVEGARLFATSNPDNPQHWLMRDYLKRASVWLRHDGQLERVEGRDRLDLARFSFRLADNPSLPNAYVEELSKTFVGLWRKRYIDGLWVLAEGAIYDMWDTAHHTTDDLPRDRSGRLALDHYTLGIDYGTTNPFVALLLGVHDATKRIYVVSEWRWDSRVKGRQMTDAEYSRALRRWIDYDLPADLSERFTVDRVYVDPSAASFLAQLYRDQWAGVHGADNAVNDGIRSVSSLFAGRHLVIDSQGDDGTIGELGGYVWDPDAAKRGKEEPLKVDDHGPDALRYGIMGLRWVWRYWLTVDPVMGELPAAA